MTGRASGRRPDFAHPFFQSTLVSVDMLWRSFLRELRKRSLDLPVQVHILFQTIIHGLERLCIRRA